MGEDAGLRRIYRPDYRDPIELPDEPELNPADIEADLKRFECFFLIGKMGIGRLLSKVSNHKLCFITNKL